MDKLFQALRPFIRSVATHAWLVVLVALALSLFAISGVRNLRIDTDLAKLIPSSYPSVQALEKLKETVGGESDVAVAIQSPSFEANKAFAEALIPRALALQNERSSEPYLTRVEYRRDTAFMERNALYFATDAELDSLESYLNEQVEAARLEANPFFFDLELEDEEESAATDDSAAAALAAVYDDLVGKEYPISADSTVLVLRFYPTGAQTNISFIENLYADLEELTAEMNPASFHPEMKITLAGRLLRQATEVRAITADVFGSFGAGASIVLLLVVVYFSYKMYHARVGRRFSWGLLATTLARTPVLAVLIGLPLLLSLSWTYGTAYLAFESLNLMTSTLGLVLFGLGIDYGIHFFARYSEQRGHGRSVVDAIEETFTTTGQAIAVGSFTTAIAMYVLMIADFRGFSEFGFIAGSGILFALVSMMIVMPALIALFERFHLIRLEADLENRVEGRLKTERVRAPKTLVGLSLALVAGGLAVMPSLQFQYQFGELEPRYEDYEAKRAVVREVYNDSGRRNPAYVVVDSPEEVPAIVAAVRAHAAQDTLTPTISHVESLQERFPMSDAARQARLDRIAEIRALLDDPFLAASGSEELAMVRMAASTTAPIEVEDVPESLRKRFTSKSGEIGNFVMIYPSVGLSDGRQSMAFAEDVGTIVTEDGRVYHAGSTSLVAADMLRLMMKEAPWMVLITLTLVAVLMLVNFRSIRWALLALVPLIVGVLWMFFFMKVFGVQLNFYNLVVLPSVLGIGNDAGVHIVQRYREEGKGSLRRILRTTGEHVSMASITTIVGFGGLLLSFHPGLDSIGQLAVIGVGATLVAALTFLPGLLQWMEDREATRPPRPLDDGMRWWHRTREPQLN
ncbi:MAG TPA: MMPL family transporter [Rhodothermales bacterium]